MLGCHEENHWISGWYKAIAQEKNPVGCNIIDLKSTTNYH